MPLNKFTFIYKVYKYEMRISDNRGCTRAVCVTRFDTAPFRCVINMCQTRTSDKLEKYCVVVFDMSKVVPNKEQSRGAFCFLLKKTAAESYRLFREAYGEHAPSQDTRKR